MQPTRTKFVPLLLLALIPTFEAFVVPFARAKRRSDDISQIVLGVKIAVENHEDAFRERLSLGHAVTQKAMLSFVAVFLLSQQAAVAAPEAYVFNHEYEDPSHPECKRKIQVNKDGNSFKYTGTAVGDKNDSTIRGCSYKEIKENGIRRENFEGRVLLDVKLELGETKRVGLWEPAVTDSDADGIRWSDGDKWIVKEKPPSTVAGEFVFLAYIGFSTLAGFKGVYDAIQRKRAES